MNENKTKKPAAEDYILQSTISTMVDYNGIDLRLSFNSLNLLS